MFLKNLFSKHPVPRCHDDQKPLDSAVFRSIFGTGWHSGGGFLAPTLPFLPKSRYQTKNIKSVPFFVIFSASLACLCAWHRWHRLSQRFYGVQSHGVGRFSGPPWLSNPAWLSVGVPGSDGVQVGTTPQNRQWHQVLDPGGQLGPTLAITRPRPPGYMWGSPHPGSRGDNTEGITTLEV